MPDCRRSESDCLKRAAAGTVAGVLHSRRVRTIDAPLPWSSAWHALAAAAGAGRDPLCHNCLLPRHSEKQAVTCSICREPPECPL